MRKVEKLKTRKITLTPSARQLRIDSEKYRLKALELGASDAKIIPTSKVVIDEREIEKRKLPSLHANA